MSMLRPVRSISLASGKAPPLAWFALAGLFFALPSAPACSDSHDTTAASTNAAGTSGAVDDGSTQTNGGAVSASSGGSSNAGGSGGTSATGVAGATGAAGSTPTPDPTADPAPIGWASVAGLEQSGTYGGKDGEVVEATTSEDLIAYAKSAKPLTIRISGHLKGTVVLGSNKTLEGRSGALIEGRLAVNNAHNVIVRNLTVQGLNCVDDASCSGGADAISVNGSHHVWFDHIHALDGSDGNLDITQGSDYVTVSWSKFSYSGTARPHRFSNLIGAADNNPIDEGHLRVTWHHNWWADNVDQRMPRTRYGQIHLFNNLYTAAGNSYCVSAGFKASVLVENNVFEGVKDPHDVRTEGNLLARGNVYTKSDGAQKQTGSAFEPPYPYELELPNALASLIKNEAGPR